MAVRHAEDHVHLVVTLARQDGAPARVSNDFYAVGRACRAAEQRLGLTGTAPRDRTAARRPSRGEREKAARAGAREAPRVRLAREVRTAAAATLTGEEFLDRLEAGGLLVRRRYSQQRPDQVTGYAVALPGDTNREGLPVWFGGGKLAPDLSWPQLASRWSSATPDPLTPGSGSGDLTPAQRELVWRRASDAAQQACAQITHLAATDPDAAGDIAHAAARLLSAAARVVDGRALARPADREVGALTAAADVFDRASRELHARLPAPHVSGEALRFAARCLVQLGRSRSREGAQVGDLLVQLALLTDAVARLRAAQHRATQAAAAAAARDRLSAMTGPPPPRVAAAAAPRLTPAATQRIPAHQLSTGSDPPPLCTTGAAAPPVHTPVAHPGPTPAPRRRVRP